MIGLLLGALFALTLVVTGCQPATPDQIARERNKMGIKSDQPKIEMSQSALLGTWESTCGYDSEKEFYYLEKIQFIADYVDHATQYYWDDHCAKKAFLKSFTGFYSLEGEKILLNYSNIFLTPEGDMAAIFNAKKTCSVSDWKSGLMRTFTDFGMCGYDSKVQYSIQRYGANELYIGNQKLILSKKTTELQ